MGRLNGAVGRMEMQVKNQMGGSIRSDGQAQWCSWKNGDTQVNNQMGRLNSAVQKNGEMQVKDQMGRLNSAMERCRLKIRWAGSIVQLEEWRDTG